MFVGTFTKSSLLTGFNFSGFLVDEDGFVLKMVDFATAGSCGFTETGFFESIFNADETERELVEARKFFPFYHGLLHLNFGGEKCILTIIILY